MSSEPTLKSTPAQLYAVLVGGALVIGGILGFFYEASFATGEKLRSSDLLGILAVNGWHNLVHIATGLLGLLAAGYAARTYALGLGLVYLLIAIWGFLVAENGVGDLLDLVPVNTEDNFLHLILGLTGLAAGAASPRLARDPARPSPLGKRPRERRERPARSAPAGE